jgi:Multiubiquitin
MSPSKSGPKQPKKIVIHIDRTKFEVEDTEMTGTELRALPEPDIGPEFDLWLEVPGGEDDRIEADEPVRLKNGIHFFTAPSTINPGRAH